MLHVVVDVFWYPINVGTEQIRQWGLYEHVQYWMAHIWVRLCGLCKSFTQPGPVTLLGGRPKWLPFNSDEGLMHLYISTDPSGSRHFISGSICPSTPFECYRRFTSPSKRAADSQNFWRLSNTDAPVYAYWQTIFPALRQRSSEKEKKLSNWLAKSRFFQSFRRDRCQQSPISRLICQISRLIFDRSHVNASHDLPACKVIALRTMDRFCVRGPNSRVGGQRKRRMESENAFRFPSLAL